MTVIKLYSVIPKGPLFWVILPTLVIIGLYYSRGNGRHMISSSVDNWLEYFSMVIKGAMYVLL